MIFIPVTIITEVNEVKIAVLSGKGGTGKTFVAVNLASVAPMATYLDCDVEEPNGHLFFKPKGESTENITLKIPVVDEEKCNACRICVNFCRFNALALVNEKLLVFEDICHSCGGCVLFCPEKALTEKDKPIGVIQKGLSDNVRVMTGILNPGEASGVPIIEKLIADCRDDKELTLIDCPPGSACVVMESIKEADYCLLVAEPSLFGVHNLAMVYELVSLFEKPCGVIINKSFEKNDIAEEFCHQHKVKILRKIPFDSELATINSEALIAVKKSPAYHEIFSLLLEAIKKEIHHETTINS